MLYTNWRSEEEELMNINFEEKFNEKFDLIIENKKKYVHNLKFDNMENILANNLEKCKDDGLDDDDDLEDPKAVPGYAVLDDRTDEGDLMQDFSSNKPGKKIEENSKNVSYDCLLYTSPKPTRPY